jgi:hypothetical protein
VYPDLEHVVEFAAGDSSMLQCAPARLQLRMVVCFAQWHSRCAVFARRVLWPVHGGRGLATVEEAGFRIWGVEAGAPKVIGAVPPSELPTEPIAAGCWDPHTPGVVALAAGTSISLVDTRSMKCVATGPDECPILPVHALSRTRVPCRRGLVNHAAHVMPARDVQFNPKKAHTLVSCGDGCKVKFWDTRSMVEPLLEFSGHTHWVWQARYNPFHDQLVLVRSSEVPHALRSA